MKKKKVLVTGAGSQLGKTLRMLNIKGYEFDYQSRYMLDISDAKEVKAFFKQKNYDYCFNFAAYTNVTQAEKEHVKSFRINVNGVANLAKAAKKHDFVLVHISTDYVFDGTKKAPYSEDDATNPINFYGKTKLMGEEIIQQYLDKYFIIRTSWLYSDYNKNFVKTMLQLARQKAKIKVIENQIGVPTYAKDLINFIFTAIKKAEKDNSLYGLYHFSNKGKASWYDFGKKVLELARIENKIAPIKDVEYKDVACRPAYSVLSKNKAEKNFEIKIRNWEKALEDFFSYQ